MLFLSVTSDRFVICPGLLHKLAYSQVPLHVAAQLILFLCFVNCCSIWCLYNGLPEFCVDYDILVDTHCWELMWSVGSHGSLSLLLMMKVVVRHFVSDTHKVMACYHPCCVSFGLARSDNICLVRSHVFLEYLSRIIDICTSYTDMHTHTSFVSLVQTHTHMRSVPAT